MMRLCKLSRATVLKYSAKYRQVCSLALDMDPKMSGCFHEPIQIDVSYFRGKRAYNRGRFSAWDKQHPDEKRARKEEEEREIKDFTGDCVLVNKQNFGDRVIGPWVLGIYRSREKVRFVVVNDKKAETLLPLFRKLIVTGEWKGYSSIKKQGYILRRVYH